MAEGTGFAVDDADLVVITLTRVQVRFPAGNSIISTHMVQLETR